MNHTYQVVGSDGQVYGPVSFEELRQWAQEGRINATTQIYRSDQTAWQPASAFSELGLPETPAAIPATPAAVRVVTPAAPTVSANPAASPMTGAAAPNPAALAPVLQQVKSGAGWFYWIAGLSLVNTIASLAGSSWGFIIGLGITQVFDAIAGAAGGSGKFIAIALDAVVLGIFVLFGFLAGKCKAWAFLVGMILYALDGLIFLVMADWMATGFHVLALYFMFKGWQACRMYNRVAGA